MAPGWPTKPNTHLVFRLWFFIHNHVTLKNGYWSQELYASHYKSVLHPQILAL